MSCLKESILQAMKTLPTIYTHTGSDGAEHPEDPNLKDLNHLAETIRKVCNLNVDDMQSDQDISKEQVVEVVELVEKELLSHPAVRPVERDTLISDHHAIRVKDDNQLSEELEKIAKEVLEKYPKIGATNEEVIMKSLFIWHGCLNIDKESRSKDVHGAEQLNRIQVHEWLVNQSNSNPWIRKGFTSAKLFRPEQRMDKDYDWIPKDSPYWEE
jgi:predicted RND superfamily exporter protein